MPHQTREASMENSFENPREAIVDGQEFIQHSLPDQIKMDQYLSAKGVGSGTKKKFLGVMLRSVSTPGTV